MSSKLMNTAFIAGVGVLELAIVLLIVLVIFGGRRLPALGRQLGDGMRGFKDSVTRRTDSQWEDEDAARAEVPALPASPAGEETPADGEVMRERS